MTPLYEEIYKKYESNKPSGIDKNIMYFEPGLIGDLVPNLGSLSIVNHLGFASPPGGQNGSDTHVLNDHTYCCEMGDTCPENQPIVEKKEICREFHNKRIGIRSEDALRLGVPLVITEFGACLDGPGCA